MKAVKGSPVVIVADIESLDTAVTAKIGTVGAAAVDVMTGRRIATFYRRIDLSLDQPGRTANEDTVTVWAKQASDSPEAWREMFEPGLPRGPLEQVLNEFADFVRYVEKLTGQRAQVMGNGPEFDNAVLAHAYGQMGIRLPWSYWVNQSLRTAVWLGRVLCEIDPKNQLARTGALHHALYDAIHEAETLLVILGELWGVVGRAERKRGFWIAYGEYGVELKSFVSGLIFAALPLVGLWFLSLGLI